MAKGSARAAAIGKDMGEKEMEKTDMERTCTGKATSMARVKKAIITALLVPPVLLASCGGRYDDSALKERLGQLEARVSELEGKVNTNTQSIQSILDAIKGGDTITGFKELDDKGGYVLTFSSGKSIKLYHGKSPAIGAKEGGDGLYYWTVDGEWLLADGKKVKAEGTDAVTPQFKIESDHWYVSYDGGKAWTKLGKAKGDDMLRSISVQDGNLEIVLADGTSFKVPLSDGSPVSAITDMVFVPGYSDGSAAVMKVGGKNVATLKYEVLPSGALEGLSKSPTVTYSAKAAYTRTRAEVGDMVDLPVQKAEIDGDFLTVKVLCDALDGEFYTGGLSASLSLRIRDGVKEAAAPYVPLFFGGEVVKSDKFDESKVVLSLGVVSDVHINTDNPATSAKWKEALRQLKSKASSSAGKLDGVLVVGDLIDNPNTSFLNGFKSVYESECDPAEVPMVYTVGNHDVPGYRWSSTMVSDAAYMRSVLGASYFLSDQDKEGGEGMECRDCVVGDYHVLAVSPVGTSPISYAPEALAWLDSRLDALTTEDPERYVIVLTHPMVYDTVYGSLLGEADGDWASVSGYWATRALTGILEKYSQAVVFGGHLHFPLNDPRSVWQGGFTALGCASVRYMAIEAGGYEDMSGATVMKDCNEFSQGNLVQFDADGNMRVFRMDFHNNAVIGGDALTMSYPKQGKSHLLKYSHSIRRLSNAAPSLSTLDVRVEGGNVTAAWAAGTDDEFVHDYLVTMGRNGSTLARKRILADFYKHPLTSSMKGEWSVDLGPVPGSEPFEVTLTAYDSWGASASLQKAVDLSQACYRWVTDEAGEFALDGGEGTVEADWLAYSTGKLTWTANTTKVPRTQEITLPSGAVASVTQVSVKDFKGSWTLRSKRFNPNGSLPGTQGTTVADETGVTFGEPLSATTLTDDDGVAHTNNIGIVGLYRESVLDAAVEIDYEARSARFGVFLDRRSAQVAADGIWCAYLPELCSTNLWTSSGYNFAPASFGASNYAWLWFTVGGDFSTMEYVYYKAGQKIGNEYVCGISIVKAGSADASSIPSGNGNYDVIYQANYNSENPAGMYFLRNIN